MNASTSSYSAYSPFSPSSSSPRHISNIDRDVLAQRALLGEDAYNSSELESPSPLATPSPMIKQLSPLTVASHLQDNMLLNPFLDDYDAAITATAARQPYSAVAPHHHSVKTDAIQKRSSRRSPSSSSAMTSISGLGLDITEERDRVSSHSNGQTRVTRHQQQSVNLDQPAATLLPIQEDISRSSPPTSRRRINNKQPAILNSYSLPPSTEMSSPSSSSSATWRRPSPFPLGPVPPPLPPRRARYEPPPHIVDVAVERFNINTRTISSPITSTTSTTSSPSSALEQERQRQWQQWEAERVRSLEMTREAAKNNRVQAPSSSSSNRTTTTTTTAVSEKPLTSSSQSTKKSKSKWWWCFSGGAVETDNEEVLDEKNNDGRSQSVASLDAIDVEEDADDEEWNEARVATGLLSSFKFSCSKSNNTRPRATLKKKTF